ncbi:MULTISPECIES: hypothetical protein [unclassified Flavonifractor]|uniref:hypothetical protein n=1 Tax=unclassified Flavonifractor TaxID=2629267 RepID=UPI000B3AF140|nr:MULTISPECIES: hypothetical protein [unclassified Flavonifractor]OUN14015.1 hypothetical protein B5G42_02990 [Flavonifractor sp. An91]HIZ93287.1 hypothetical protein [Candidatus Flavonifractor avicola]
MELNTLNPDAEYGLMDALAVYLPFFIGLIALVLIVLAVLPKLPKPMRILFGIAGGALLFLALWYFIFHTNFS